MFTLYKASGARVPDLISDLGAGATLGADIANLKEGLALQISGGALEVGATLVPVAGICAMNGENISSYAAASGKASVLFPDGFKAGSKVMFLPVTGTVPIEADVVAAKIAIADGLPGAELDIAADGLTLTTKTNGDFRIVKVLEDDGTYVTKVAGFFLNPGYFAA